MTTETTTRRVDLRPGDELRLGDFTLRLDGSYAGPSPVPLALTEPAAPKDLPFRCTYRRPASCTPAEEAAVLALAAHYCRKVVRFTVLNPTRFSAIHARLKDGYSMERCLVAINAYAATDWNKKNKVWLDLADFFSVKKLDQVMTQVREIRNRAEKAEEQRPAADSKVRQVVDHASRRMDIKNEEQRRLEAFTALSPDEQRELLVQAMNEVITLFPQRAGTIQASLGCHPVKMQVLVILKRRSGGG